MIKETALAASIIVYCGEDSISWAYLDSVRVIFGKYEQQLLWSGMIKNMIEYLDLVNSDRNSFRIYPDDPVKTLICHQDKAATDRRDKAFALIGVTPGLDSPGSVNYGCSTEEVSKKTVEVVVTHTKKVDIICEGGIPSDTHLLPSWTPDWSTGERDSVSFITIQGSYEAATTNSAVVKFSGNVLTCAGFCIGSVKNIGTVYSITTNGLSKDQLFVKASHEWHSIVYSFASGESASQESFLKAIYLNDPRSGETIYSDTEFKSAFFGQMMALTKALCPDLPVNSAMEKFIPQGKLHPRVDQLDMKLKESFFGCYLFHAQQAGVHYVRVLDRACSSDHALARSCSYAHRGWGLVLYSTGLLVPCCHQTTRQSLHLNWRGVRQWYDVWPSDGQIREWRA